MIDFIFQKLNQYVVLRYVISGGTSASVDLSVLFILNTLLSVHYLVSASVAFIVAFGVSFTLHKFWTFKTHIEHDTRKQLFLYLGTSLVGLCLNTLLMYVFVSHVLYHPIANMHVRVIVSQVFVGILVACCTFFISRRFVFKWHLNKVHAK